MVDCRGDFCLVKFCIVALPRRFCLVKFCEAALPRRFCLVNFCDGLLRYRLLYGYIFAAL